MKLISPKGLMLPIRTQATAGGPVLWLAGMLILPGVPRGLVIYPPVQIDKRTWRVTWTCDLVDPVFYVYRDGVLVTATRQTHIDFSVDPGESLLVEVLTDAGRPPTSAFPARLTLNWYGVTDAEHYRIEEYVGAAWTLRGQVRDKGQGCFRWISRPLEDSASHQFRIIAVGNNTQGTALALTCLMVRHPDPPQVSLAYSNSAHKVTVTAA